MKTKRAVALTSALAIAVGANVVVTEEARAQNAIDDLMRQLPQSVNVAGREIPVTPPLLAAVVGIPALAAIIGIIVVATPDTDGSTSNTGSSASQSSLSSSDKSTPTSSSDTSSSLSTKNRTLTGRVLELSNRDLTGKDVGVNGETAASRYYVLQLDSTIPFTARMNGNMGRPDTRNVNRVLLGARTYTRYGSHDTSGEWPGLVGKRVTFDYSLDDAWWPSDARMPVGMASISKVQNLTW